MKKPPVGGWWSGSECRVFRPDESRFGGVAVREVPSPDVFVGISEILESIRLG